MSRRLGQLTKFILVVIALAACGGSKGSSSQSGPVATDLQTSINGWSFPNFPASAFPKTDFDEADLVSMFGSGDEICVGAVATPCTLTAEASAWARMVNQSRASGHCEGLVAIASTRFNNKETPETVKIPSQEETLHALMRAFATQFLPEVQDAITMWINKSLEEKIDELKNSFVTGNLNYTLGLYTEGGGHALLPYAVEYPTPTTPKILLYDSNWPGKNRYVDVDLEAKTWRFSFSGEDPANDSGAWTGGPQDMDLTPLSARTGTCPFCGDGTKVAKTTMLIRSSNLDWSVETDGGVVSPANPVGTDGTAVLPVKGFLKRDSYDYYVSVPNATDSKTATTVAKKKTKKTKSKLKFSGSTSVYAMMPDGIAQFTTSGKSDNPVEIEGSSISTKDPAVDLTLASGNLVANASGAAISLSVSGGEMAVSVTTASGQVVQQQVSEDKPTLQMKADPTGGGITVLAATSTGVVEKTAVSSTGVETKTIVKEVLNLSAVKAELPPELASKEIAALPSLANRNMANPNYKVDPVYVAPTTTAPKESSGGVVKNGALQAPTVGRLILPSVEFDDVPFTVQPPTSNSKGEWRFSSSKPDVAQVAATGRVTIISAGTATITATQSAVKDYESISVTAELTVSRATPVIGAFTTTTRTVGEEAFTLANPTSTSSAVFKLESSDESVAKFSKVNGKLSIVGAGRTTITASQPANDDYLAASRNFLLTVRKGTPILSAIADLSSTFGENGPTIAKPTSESRGAVTFTSSNAAVATINATTGQASIVSAGATTVTAYQAATDDYVSATQTLTFTVKPAQPELGALNVASKTFGDSGFTIGKPTSLSSGSFTFTSSNSNVVKISEAGAATIEGAGTATITATQAASGNYSANSVTADITVAKGTPELSNISLTGLVFGSADVTMQPRSTSSGAFTFASNNSRVLTVNETTGRVRVVSAGTATVTVKQASTSNYEAASSSVTVQVGLATPAFQRLDPITKEFGDASFLWNWGTSPSDGTITYASSDPNTATINASTGRVTIVGTGVTTLKMTQSQGTNHSAASTVVVLTVSRATPVYGDFIIANRTYPAASFLLTAPSSNSDGAFTYSSSNENVATVNATTGRVTLTGVGSTTITASQVATASHTSASISTTLTVISQASDFTTNGPNDFYFDLPAGITFTLRTYAQEYGIDSQLWLYNSSNTLVADNDDYYGLDTYISYNVQNAGTYRLRTSICCGYPDSWYGTSYRVVAKGTPQFSGFALPGSGYRAGDESFNTTNATSSNSSGAVTYSSSNTAVATINATTGRVTLVGAGNTTLTATLAAEGFWNGATLTLPLPVGASCALGGECRIGDVGPGGGRIFLLPTSTGNSTNKFFEAAPSDLSSALAWCNDITTSISGANGYAFGTGEANTTAIDAACTSGAAQGAADYTNNSIGDWYLPSLDELTTMLAERTTIGGFASASYWSSSEENGEFAKRLGFPDGGMSGHVKSQLFQVRPIRSFEIRRSCLDIKNATGTNTNGIYTIALNVGGAIVNTPVYCLMDSTMSGGGWTLTMKAPSYSTSFGFNANYWTTANTLNAGNTSDVTSDATNAKFNTFNYLSGTEMLAIFPDAGINGGSVTGQTYGWTWKQTIPSGPKTPLEIFSGPMEQFIGDADNFSGFNTQIFSRQADIRFYGFNWNDNWKSRWGFGWNENGGGLWPNGVCCSNDVTGGIGLNWGEYSAGDGHFGYSTSVGLSRPMSFETYVR